MNLPFDVSKLKASAAAMKDSIAKGTEELKQQGFDK